MKWLLSHDATSAPRLFEALCVTCQGRQVRLDVDANGASEDVDIAETLRATLSDRIRSL